jgi:uncharacterized protein
MINSLTPVVWVAVAVQLSCQIFKFILYSVRDRSVSPQYLVNAGGFPSAHSAFVASLSTGVGVVSGLNSTVFAVAVVFSSIVVYDAFRLRGHVQNHAKRINALIERTGMTGDGRVSEMVGHSIPEIVGGIVYGSVGTLVVFSVFYRL